MHSLFRLTLTRLALYLGLGVLVGYQFSNVWLGLTLALAVYIGIMLFNFGRFQQWLATGTRGERPVTNTFWTNIIDQISRIIRQLDRENAALRADIDFFKDSFEALDSAVIVLNEKGEIEWSNIAAHSLLGVSQQRDYGQLLVNLLRAPHFKRYLDKADFSAPLLINSPRGSGQRLEIQATPFRNNSVLIFSRDISEVEHLEKVRQDFIANVSHELRTPLTVINGYLDTLKDNNARLPEAFSGVLEKMHGQSRRMDNLVTDLIWLSRLDTTPEAESTENIPLAGMLQGIIQDALVIAPDKNIALRVGGEDKVGRVSNATTGAETASQASDCISGNYDELRAAFSNLVQNAVKYTQADGHIEINCQRFHDTYRVQVKDDGVGIDPVHLPRLTERFYRVDDSRTSSTGGTGLGLAIVKHVLKRHAATLEITSHPGKGSSFTCVFPLDRLIRPESSTASNIAY